METNELRILLQAIVQRLDIIANQNQKLINIFEEEVEEQENENEINKENVKRKEINE